MLDNKRNVGRILNFKIIIIILFVILLGRAFYIQIYHGEKYRELSEQNRTSTISISAPRGRIYDSNEEIIVSNKLAHTVSIMRREVNEDSINQLSEILDIPKNYIIDRIKNSSEEIVRIKSNISRQELILLEEFRNELAGLYIDQMPIRDYIYDSMASHVLGYLGEISSDEIKELEGQGYSSRDIIGKTGVEKVYEEYLRGTRGKEIIETNNVGQKIRSLGTEEPEAGNDLILNLDHELQKKAERLLEEELNSLKERAEEDDDIKAPPEGGAAIVADPNDGSILAMASMPNYDLSKFLTGMTGEEWQKLYRDPNMPLLNRAISTSAPPGSIFKLTTAAAAMEELGVKADDKFYDPGYYELGDVEFRNWYPRGQGDINFIDSIAWSNNTTFYKLGHQLYEKDQGLLQDYAKKFSLGSRSGIDLTNETTGLIPDPDWRRNYFTSLEDRIWLPGYTINLSIGQGNLRTSPIQLTNLINGIANQGQIYKPRILDKIINQDGEIKKENEAELLNDLQLDSEIIEVIKEGLLGVTTYGTARNTFEDFPISMAGKTGTAQAGGDRPNHGWFAGFAPEDDPEISVVVFLEYGSSSSNTLPVVRGLLKEYFEFEEEVEETEELEDGLLQEDYDLDIQNIESEIDEPDMDEYIPETD